MSRHNLPEGVTGADFDDDGPTCPWCDAPLIVNADDRYCYDVECSECDYEYYTDNFDD